MSSLGSPVAHIILSYAADHGMDLIVIDCLQPRPFSRVGLRWRNANFAEAGAYSGPDVTVRGLRSYDSP
jgi:hypothetical protein